MRTKAKASKGLQTNLKHAGTARAAVPETILRWEIAARHWEGVSTLYPLLGFVQAFLVRESAD